MMCRWAMMGLLCGMLLPSGVMAVDIDEDGMPDAWEALHGLDALDPADARLDPDGDGINNLGEYFADTLPLDATAFPGKEQLPTLISTYYGNQGWAMDEIQRLEAWQARKNAVVLLYTSWNPDQHFILFHHQLPNIWNNGNVPLITWEPSNPSHAESPDDIEALIAAGEYDAYITEWATDLKVFLAGGDGVFGNDDDRRAYLSLGHEMNGVWYPWSGAPAQYIAMWQRVHDRFAVLGIDEHHLQWIWTVNNVDIGAFTAEEYYPGNDYVDWVGINGYNWGRTPAASNWFEPARVYGDMLMRMRALSDNKPVAFTEVGVATDGSAEALAGKNIWITQLYTYVRQQGIGLVNWFNEDKSGYDWQMFEGLYGTDSLPSGEQAFPAYKDAVNYTGFISADWANPRLITHEQFQGKGNTLSVPLANETLQGIEPDTLTEFSVMMVSDLSAPVNLMITKGEYRINGGAYSREPVTVRNGDVVQVRHTSSKRSRGRVKTLLKVGKKKVLFTSTVFKFDAKPDAVRFAVQKGVSSDELAESEAVTVKGINVPVPVRVVGGEYCVNGGEYTSKPGTIRNGDVVQVRHMTHARAGKRKNTLLKIGRSKARFSSVTRR